MEYFVIEFNNDMAKHLSVEIKDSKHQTFWEFLVLVLTLIQWGKDFAVSSLAVLGDNTGSLRDAMDLKGKGALLALVRELSWRSARANWAFAVGHIPTERNTVADSLSRLHEARPAEFPPALRQATRREPPSMSRFWRSRVE